MFETPMILAPAYGVKYNSVEEIKEAYLSGKDFKLLHTGQYCSNRDFRNCEVSLWLGNGMYVQVISE